MEPPTNNVQRMPHKTDTNLCVICLDIRVIIEKKQFWTKKVDIKVKVDGNHPNTRRYYTCNSTAAIIYDSEMKQLRLPSSGLRCLGFLLCSESSRCKVKLYSKTRTAVP